MKLNTFATAAAATAFAHVAAAAAATPAAAEVVRPRDIELIQLKIGSVAHTIPCTVKLSA